MIKFKWQAYFWREGFSDKKYFIEDVAIDSAQALDMIGQVIDTLHDQGILMIEGTESYKEEEINVAPNEQGSKGMDSKT